MEAQEVTAATPTPIWSSIREALRGSHQDFTAGSLNRAILLLAIPVVLEMVLESLFAVVDVFWGGRLGADAVATVGLTESPSRPTQKTSTTANSDSSTISSTIGMANKRIAR